MLKTAFCRNFKGRNLMAKEMIAMILAGGQGSRLYALTQKLAKPAVPFGGKYRIIDFPLSNCVNSDIDTVGILTQYQPLVLNEYIGTASRGTLTACTAVFTFCRRTSRPPAPTGTRARPTPSIRTCPSLTAMTPSMSSSCPATRSASRITLTSCASIRRRTQSSPSPSWRCHGARHPASA